jgi:hypothetical protein
MRKLIPAILFMAAMAALCACASVSPSPADEGARSAQPLIKDNVPQSVIDEVGTELWEELEPSFAFALYSDDYATAVGKEYHMLLDGAAYGYILTDNDGKVLDYKNGESLYDEYMLVNDVTHEDVILGWLVKGKLKIS